MADLKPLAIDGLLERMIWEKPERKDQAGTLVIFGGVSLKLKEVDTIFKAAKNSGIGSSYALVPESLARVFKRDDQYLVPVNFDGYYGLSDTGQKTLLEEFSLADGLVLADVGKSSATEHKLALVIAKSFKPVIITDSAVNLVLSYASEILNNPRITLVLNLQSFQKVIKVSNLKLEKPLLSDSSFKTKFETLAAFSSSYSARVILIDDGYIYSVDQEVFLHQKLEYSELSLSAQIACWQIWAPRSSYLEQVFVANSNS